MYLQQTTRASKKNIGKEKVKNVPSIEQRESDRREKRKINCDQPTLKVFAPVDDPM